MAVKTRRERREQDRQRQKRRATGGDRRGDRSTLLTGAIAAGLLILVVLGLRAAGVFEPPPQNVDAADSQFQGGTAIGTKVADQGNTHVATGTTVTYNSVPPTSGSHWDTAAPWGIKDAQLPNETTTHNLEHGGIVIAYNGLSPEDVSQLKSLVRGLGNPPNHFRKIVLEPYSQLADAKIAVTSWDWIMKLNTLDQAQIIRFINAHYDGQDAPERGVP